MQTDLSRIWIYIALSISYDYTTNASSEKYQILKIIKDERKQFLCSSEENQVLKTIKILVKIIAENVKFNHLFNTLTIFYG